MWPGSNTEKQTLEIATEDNAGEIKKAFYPPPTDSRRLALGNIWFPFKNPDFSLLLGLLYWICALLMLAWRGIWRNWWNGDSCGPYCNSAKQSLADPCFPINYFGFIRDSRDVLGNKVKKPEMDRRPDTCLVSHCCNPVWYRFGFNIGCWIDVRCYR